MENYHAETSNPACPLAIKQTAVSDIIITETAVFPYEVIESYRPLTIFLISLSLLSASTGVRLLMSSPNISSRI